MIQRLIFVTFLSIFLLTPINRALAASGQRYPSGAEDFLCGVAPGPGFYLVNYSYWYSSSSLRDNGGNDIKGLDFHVNVLVDAPRFLYFFPSKFLGAIYGIYIALPVFYADIETRAHGITLAADHTSGVGDLIFSPLILGWHFLENRLHMIFSFDITAPTGHYDGKNIATTILSTNYWTFQPNLAITWITTHGIDVSAKVLYEFHTSNDEFYLNPYFKKMSYSPGSGINIDFAVGVPLSSRLRIGINGFYYQQLEDDKIDEKKVQNNRVSNFALGPALEFSGPNWGIILKEQFEIKVKNRPKGNVTWLKFQYEF